MKEWEFWFKSSCLTIFFLNRGSGCVLAFNWGQNKICAHEISKTHRRLGVSSKPYSECWLQEISLFWLTFFSLDLSKKKKKKH